MKKVFVLILLSLFMVAGNVVAADLTGFWDGHMYCSDDLGESSEYFFIEITQSGDFFTSYNFEPSLGEVCGGVVDGNNMYMTCPGTFAYGTINQIKGKTKGKSMWVINHVPSDAKTCKGTVIFQGTTNPFPN